MKAILLIGLNHFGTLLARQLYELGHEIMAVDRNEERVNDILPFVTDAQIGDSTNEAFLRSLGINNYDVCIVTIGEDFYKVDHPYTNIYLASSSAMARPFRLARPKPAGSMIQTSVSGMSGSAMTVMPRPLMSLTITAT